MSRPIFAVGSTVCGDRLRKALAKRTKDDLMDVLVELAREDRNILRRLSERFELEAPLEELVVATRRAIADATDFDERDVNHNFDYDDVAYSEVNRNLSRLVDQSRNLPLASSPLESGFNPFDRPLVRSMFAGFQA